MKYILSYSDTWREGKKLRILSYVDNDDNEPINMETTDKYKVYLIEHEFDIRVKYIREFDTYKEAELYCKNQYVLHNDGEFPFVLDSRPEFEITYPLEIPMSEESNPNVNLFIAIMQKGIQKAFSLGDSDEW